MFDFKFDWCKEMECGIEIIDEQHQELFRIIRGIEQLIMNGCKNVTHKQLLDIVCELREYISYHFYTEENLMERFQYPKLATHMAEHLDLKEYILNIDMPMMAKEPVQVLTTLKEHMQNYLFNHILQEDYSLCRFLAPYAETGVLVPQAIS